MTIIGNPSYIVFTALAAAAWLPACAETEDSSEQSSLAGQTSSSETNTASDPQTSDGGAGSGSDPQSSGSQSTATTASSTDPTQESAESGDSETETGNGDPHECLDPVPLPHPGTQEATGWIACSDGFLHRAEILPIPDRVQPVGDCPPLDEHVVTDCRTDADCNEQARGTCRATHATGGMLDTPCSCGYACASDSDCREGQICAPAGFVVDWPACIDAPNCRSSDDCDDGLCGLSHLDRAGCEFAVIKATCAGALERCHADSDCPHESCPTHPNAKTQYECTADADGVWGCRMPQSCWEQDCG